jgi:hypothetical protein
MLTTTIRRRAALFAVAGLVVVLPLSACGSDSTTTAEAREATPATTTVPAGPTADAGAIWAVLRALPVSDVATLHAGFTAEVRAEIDSIIHAAAESGR